MKGWFCILWAHVFDIRCMDVPEAEARQLQTLGSLVSDEGALNGTADSSAFLAGGGSEAVFVFFIENGGGRMAVGIADKAGKDY